MIKYNVIYCDDCGAKIEPGNRPDGVPNGVRFQYKDGTAVDVCAACIIIRKGEKQNEGNRLNKQKGG